MRIDAAGRPNSAGFRPATGPGLPTGSIRRQAEGVTGSRFWPTARRRVDRDDRIATALAAAGVTVVAIDIRGHGASGTRGDIAYPGQLDDDLADLVGELRRADPGARFSLIGHSAGGGFALRIAGSPLGETFDRFVLLAPYLGYTAPTNRPAEGPGLWASPDLPRIIATLNARKDRDQLAAVTTGHRFCQHARGKNAGDHQYSFRLLMNYTAPPDWKGAFLHAKGRIAVVAGEDDELMDAEAYRRVLPPLGARVTIVPGVDHMGVVYRPESIKAILAAMGERVPERGAESCRDCCRSSALRSPNSGRSSSSGRSPRRSG